MRDDVMVFIMAGGIGTRFWPASRKDYAKQFHRLVDEHRSLLQSTFDRFNKVVPAEKIFVITSIDQVAMSKEHLPQLADHQIIAEPERKNTGPATLLGSLVAEHACLGTHCVFTPADATIHDVPTFIENIHTAIDYISVHDGIVTLGIKPTEAHTGYGYIQYQKQDSLPYPVLSFKEKPSEKVAEEYLTKGSYLWNAGIFVWRSDYIIRLFRELASDMLKVFEDLAIYENQTVSAESLKEIYGQIQGESVDYLIMEQAPKVFTIPGDFGWSDVGNWRALYDYLPKTDDANVIQSDRCLLDNVKNSLIKSNTGKLIVAKDLDGYVIVETDKTLLIYPLDKEQEIKEVRKKVNDQFGEDYI